MQRLEDESEVTAHCSTSSSVNVDDLSKAYGHMRFRDSYKKTIAKPSWYKISECSVRRKNLIEKLQCADEQLQAIIVGGKLWNEWEQYSAVRKRIKDIFIELLRHEMKFCRQHNVEQHFWKILHYNLIESTRRLANDKANEHCKSYQRICLSVIDDGIELFENILLLLAQTYDFKLENFLGVESGRNLRGLKYISLALVSAQKCCMCLGDLLRYRELINESTHFEEAAQWYVKAYQLIPSNGMPSNQLAILALYNKRKFDAIFYHMRSLNASNPIKSAKESLVILFDELRKKYQSQKVLRQPKTEKTEKISEHFKREIWVHPTDGQLNYRTVFLDQENEPLDSADLYKKFILNFSHLHGILFTRVGSDSLEICIEQTLKQFQELLNHRTPGVFTLQKMVQMIVLNIYSVENSMQLSSPSQYALVFSFTFLGIILNKLQHEMSDMLATNSSAIAFETKKRNSGEPYYNVKQINKFKLTDSINNSLATISLWCNWLKFNWASWTADSFLFAVHKFGKTYGICVWEEFARFAAILDKFNFEIDEQLLLRTEMLEDDRYKRIRLPEDMLTLGVPQIIRNDFVYCKQNDDEHSAYTILRWQNIFKFCTVDLMTGERFFLRRQLPSGKIVSTRICARNEAENSGVDHLSSKDIVLAESACSAIDLKPDGNLANESNASSSNPHIIDNDLTTTESSEEIQKLLQRKNELEESHKMHEKLNQFTQDILRETNANTVCMEIRPKYLIPDTNCFIDFLPEIKQLTNVHPLYHVVLPIVVLNELEGLAKGDESGTKTYDTPTKTSLNAHKALVFLKNSGSAIKCATTRGSFLNSMIFTTESNSVGDGPTEYLNNDDKILLTAINLSKLYSADSILHSTFLSSTNLQRKTVLLTNDRNLKLKAITQNIPVRELVDFIKWSGIAK